MDPAVFLDRDGVIIENVDSYVRNWEDVVFYPSSLHALNLLATSSYKIVITTNQSAIGRGIISQSQAKEINQQVISTVINAGGRVDGLFMCPHSPQDRCACRKPLPGLILQAADALSLDLNKSITIGDALTDIQAGQAAGIPTNIIVKTGRGSTQLTVPLAASLPKFFIYDDLSTAVEDILSSGLLKP